MISEEAVNQHLSNIDEYFANSDFNGLFQEAKILYEETNGKNAYFLGACYLNAWGTPCNLDMAIPYLEEAARNRDNYEYATYLAGLAYYRKANYPKAVEWLIEAEKAENYSALSFLADAAAACAFNLWDRVRGFLRQGDFAEGVLLVKSYVFLAVEKYMRAAELAPESMNNLLWCGYGRLFILLYNLSTSGCLTLDDLNDNSLSGMVSAGMQVLSARWDHDAHYEIFKMGITACDFMADHGAELVAEHFRAFLSLMESERHKSAEAFYRARWHMKRIGELRAAADPAAVKEISDTLRDMDAKYEQQNNRYGAMVLSMMRAGQLPDISISYCEGNAPAVESCENFMKMVRQEQARVRTAETSKSTEKKTGGFLKNLFKL